MKRNRIYKFDDGEVCWVVKGLYELGHSDSSNIYGDRWAFQILDGHDWESEFPYTYISADDERLIPYEA